MAGGRPKAASGLVSVMPQPWMISAPTWLAKASMSARGTADPPQVTDLSEQRSAPGLAPSARSRSFQIVGTPQDSVAFWSSMMVSRRSPCMNSWGMTMSAPTIQQL